MRITLLHRHLLFKTRTKRIILSPLSPHIVILDQGTDVIVDFVSRKPEHEVLSMGLATPGSKLFLERPWAHLANCSLSFEIKSH